MRTLFQSKKAVLTLLAMLAVSVLATIALVLYVETFDQAMTLLAWTLGSLTTLGTMFVGFQSFVDRGNGGAAGGTASGVAP